MWDLPRPGLEPVSPALAGRFSTTAPQGKPLKHYFNAHFTRRWGNSPKEAKKKKKKVWTQVYNVHSIPFRGWDSSRWTEGLGHRKYPIGKRERISKKEIQDMTLRVSKWTSQVGDWIKAGSPTKCMPFSLSQELTPQSVYLFFHSPHIYWVSSLNHAHTSHLEALFLKVRPNILFLWTWK